MRSLGERRRRYLSTLVTMISPAAHYTAGADPGERPARLTLSSPVDLVRELYARHRRRDLRGMLKLLSPAIEITQGAGLPWAGRFRGHAGAREYFLQMSRHADAVAEPIIHVPSGNDVVVVGRIKGWARASRREIDVVVAHVWTVRAGQIERLAAFVDTPAMQVALGAK